jgi:hypothetical protein
MRSGRRHHQRFTMLSHLAIEAIHEACPLALPCATYDISIQQQQQQYQQQLE